MSEENGLIKCTEPNDPDRCQGNFGRGSQCWFKVFVATNGKKSQYCVQHSPKALVEDRRDIKRNYFLGMWQRRVDEFADSSHVKSLREEIGLLRMLMEETVKKCTDPAELLLNAPRIIQLVASVTQTINVCHTLEEKTKFLLDKSAILMLVTQLLNVITEHVTDRHILEKIAIDVENLLVKSQEVVDAPTNSLVSR